jgi:hypothetical protein
MRQDPTFGATFMTSHSLRGTRVDRKRMKNVWIDGAG